MAVEDARVSVQGRVLWEVVQNPAAGAEISLSTADQEVFGGRADQDGKFSTALYPGEYKAEVVWDEITIFSGAVEIEPAVFEVSVEETEVRIKKELEELDAEVEPT